MAQDEGKGQSPSTRGKSPAPSAPESPDARAINAPPPPEAPEAPEPPANEPADDAAEEQGAADAGEAGEAGGALGGAGAASGGASSGGAGAASESKALQDKIDKANKDLDALKAQFALAEERRKAEEATAKKVEDYGREEPALNAIEKDMKRYRQAEIKFVSQFLTDAQKTSIAEASAAEQQKIDDLADKIETAADAAAEKQAELDLAKVEAAKARAEAQAFKLPAASIRDRLKAAEAIRSEAKKASDSGNYALAYWLVMDCGQLEKKVEAEPRVIPTSDLETAVRKSAADQVAADQKVALLEKEVKTAEAALQADRAELAKLKAGFEASVRASLAKFNPNSAETA